jgi:glycosyltransferase involved in cell wall biosynthesis
MNDAIGSRPLRIGIATDALRERMVEGEARIANGGVGVYIYQLVKHLLTVDTVNEYFLMRPGKGLLDIYRHPRVRTVFLPDTKFHRAAALLGSAYARPTRELRLDLMHFPNMFGGGSLSASVKQVATVHDLTPLIMPASHPMTRVIASRMAIGRAMRRSHRVIVPSRATADDLVSRRLLSRDKIICIPSGINPLMKRVEPTPELATRYHLTNPFVLTVGVLEPRKNQMILLEVLRELRNQGHQLDLVIIGRPGWRWNPRLAMEKNRDIWPSVKILVDVPDSDLAEFYSRAELFFYPSLYEGFGLPILEAMACGTPVISSSTSSMPEVGGPAALYADPHDARAFASHAIRLLCDRALRQSLIDAGVERARKFSWEASARATLAVYEEVAHGNVLNE